MPEPEQLLLAALTGGLFGVLVAIIGSSWQRLAVLLLLLWTMQTGPQYVYRWLDGQEVTREIVVVTVLRVIFAASAGIVLALMNRYWHKRARS
jgi:hypothetical protein